MFSWLKGNKVGSKVAARPMVEGLESRALFSVSGTPSLLVTIPSTFPSQGIAGEKFNGKIAVNVANNGTGPTTGNYSFTIYASTDQTLSNDDAQLATITRGFHLNEGANKTLIVNVKTLANNLDGSYYLLGQVSGMQTTAYGASSGTISITPAHVDLNAGVFSVPAKGHITKSISVGIAISNLGNELAKGTISIAYSASTLADGSDGFALATLTKAIHINPLGKQTIKIRQNVKIPAGVISGNEYITVTVDSGNVLNDSNLANNFAVSLTPVSLT